MVGQNIKEIAGFLWRERWHWVPAMPAVIVEELGVNLFPDVARQISPLVENHFGNVPWSMLAVGLVYLAAEKIKGFGEVVKDKSGRSLIWVWAILAGAAANIGNETFKAGELLFFDQRVHNCEFGGDVAMGLLAAGLMIGIEEWNRRRKGKRIEEMTIPAGR